MINARSETVETTRSYRVPFQRKRCLVPIDGWYEWRKTGSGKQPYFITSDDGEPLLLAGMWEFWPKTEPGLLTCTILTTAATGEFARIHDRMPLIIPLNRVPAWLGEDDSPAPSQQLLRPPEKTFLDTLEIRPVSKAVGNVRNDDARLIERVDPPDISGNGTSEPTLF